MVNVIEGCSIVKSIPGRSMVNVQLMRPWTATDGLGDADSLDDGLADSDADGLGDTDADGL